MDPQKPQEPAQPAEAGSNSSSNIVDADLQNAIALSLAQSSSSSGGVASKLAEALASLASSAFGSSSSAPSSAAAAFAKAAATKQSGPDGHIDPVLLSSLQSMGFNENRSKRCLIAISNKSIDAAIEWMSTHSDDASLDAPFEPVAAPAAPAPSVLPPGFKIPERKLTARGAKMVLIVRDDLGMGKGKIAAQCCHGCLGAYRQALETEDKDEEAWFEDWEENAEPKVVVKCPSMDEMNRLKAVAKAVGCPYYTVVDAGRTQIAPGSRTVLALGPAPVEMVDAVSGHLKLM